MKNIKNQFRRAFTIVELVIVIVVIAALAAVLIPTFANVINAANESVDTSLVKNLNTSLVAVEGQLEKNDDDIYNVTEAITLVRNDGYDVSKLTPSADNADIVYNASTNRFLYYTDNFADLSLGEEPDSDDVLVVIDNTLSRIATVSASESLISGNTVHYCVYSIDGADISTSESINIWLYTESGNTIIDAVNSIVYRYGVSDSDTVSVDDNSYHLFGTVKDLLLKQGHVEFNSTAVVTSFIIDSAVVGTPTITIVNGATISEFISESNGFNSTAASYTIYTKESDSETGKGTKVENTTTLDISIATSIKFDSDISFSSATTLLADITTENVVLDLNGNSLTATAQLTIKNANIKTLTVSNGIVNCNYNNSSSGILRIEKATTVNFIDVEFVSNNTKNADLAVQTYYAAGSDIDYAFTNCSFTNTFVKFTIRESTENNCNAIFNNCIFTDTIADSGTQYCVYFDTYVYGSAIFNNCDFSVMGGDYAIDAEANSGGTFEVTLNNVDFTGTATSNTYFTKYYVPKVAYLKNACTITEKGSNNYWLKFGEDSEDLYSFTGSTSINGLNIPATVTEIPEVALQELIKTLTSITVSAGNTSYKLVNNNLYTYDMTTLVVYIGANNIASFTIPDTVTKINAYAFYINKIIEEIIIPDSVITIGDYAFYQCTNLAKVTIGNSVTTIGSYAFYKCSALASIVIPSTVTSIGSYAFTDCSNLKTVYNLSSLGITKGKTTYGYVAYYADNVYTSLGE